MKILNPTAAAYDKLHIAKGISCFVCLDFNGSHGIVFIGYTY